MRAVVDTNVLVSGLLWRGAPHTLLQYLRDGQFILISSSVLLAELADVIGRAKFDDVIARTNTSREGALVEVRQLAEVIEPPPLPHPICRDPDDDALLALALAGGVDRIVTGDDDLLALKSFEGIPIVTPAQAIEMLS